jgi:hypothetical protein
MSTAVVKNPGEAPHAAPGVAQIGQEKVDSGPPPGLFKPVHPDHLHKKTSRASGKGLEIEQQS